MSRRSSLMVAVVGAAVLGVLLLRATAFRGDPERWGRTPSWSPDGTRVVFECSRHRLCIADRDGDDRQVLVSNGEPLTDGFSPAWAPDGERIAFYRPAHDGMTEAWVVDLGVGTARRVARTGDWSTAFPHGLSWSPDGRRLAFVFSDFGGETDDLVVLDTRTGLRTRLGAVGGRFLSSMGGPTETRWAHTVRPAWSPRGGWIAAEVGQGIQLFGVDRRRRRPLVSRGSDPSWSPDGREILFERDDQLQVIRSDGSQTRPLAANEYLVGHGMSPTGTVWSPDGRHIAFWDCCPAAYTMATDGTDVHSLG